MSEFASLFSANKSRNYYRSLNNNPIMNNLRYDSIKYAPSHSIKYAPSHSIKYEPPHSMQQKGKVQGERQWLNLSQMESKLQGQIRRIDTWLEKQYKNMKYRNGLLFQLTVDIHLANEIRWVIDSQIQINSWGFGFLQSHTLHRKASPRVRADRANPSSQINNYDKLILKKYYGAGLHPNKWEYFSKPASHKRHNLKTQPTEREGAQSLLISDPFNLQAFSPSSQLRPRSLKAVRLNHSQNSRSRISPQAEGSAILERSIALSPPAILEAVEKEGRVLSIWLPPSSTPQLVGLLSIFMQPRQDSTHTCFVKKYWWAKKLLSKRVFNCILDFLSSHYTFTEELTLLTNKVCFEDIFAPLGWRLSSWVQEEKIRISYKRNLL